MDSIFEEIGPFGKFQKLTIILLGLIFSFTSSNMFFTVFSTASPNIVCNYNDDFYTNETLLIYNETAVCKILSNVTIDSKLSDYGCEYDKHYYSKTIVTEWNLICNRKYISSLTQTIYMFGSLTSLFGGVLGDCFGRRRILVSFLLLSCLILFTTEFLQFDFIRISSFYKYIFYCINLFFGGLIGNCIYGNAFVLLMEITTSKYHTISSILGLYAFTFGELLVLIISYFIRNWHIYNWILSGMSFLIFILAFIFLPESPRWLISKKKFNEADIVFHKIAKINKRLLRRYYYQTELNNLLMRKHAVIIDNDNENDDERGLAQLFCPIRNTLKTFLLMYTFISLALVYYGISFGITTIENLNPYLAYLMSVIAEIAGYTLSIINVKLGRKKSNIIFLILSSISSFFVGLVPSLLPHDLNNFKFIYTLIMLILISISKCMASAAFNNIWIYASELYPTSTRTSALLLLNGTSRIGALIAPIVNLSRFFIWKHMPYLTFSLMSFFAGIFAFMLPETLIH